MKAHCMLLGLVMTISFVFVTGNVNADETIRLKILEKRMASLEAENAALRERVEELEASSIPKGIIGTVIKYIPGELNGVKGPHIIIEGANLHVRSGSGSTEDGGSPIGLGNLIIGYNEPTTPIVGRGGSHNLVIGKNHEYSSYAGLVAGRENSISAPSASVSGGYGNEASSSYAAVGGGAHNAADGEYSSVSGGYSNVASGDYSSVSGGQQNTAGGSGSSISGGSQNTADGGRSSVGGGTYNAAAGDDSSVSGGYLNVASGISSSVSGGQQNTAGGSESSISGGALNTADGEFSSVSGGFGHAVIDFYDWKAGACYFCNN